MITPFKILALAFLVLVTAVSCGRQEEILEGERLDIRAVLVDPEAEEVDVAEPDPVVVDKLALAAPVRNTEWTHKNGSAEHLITHPALARVLKKIWSASIGSGNSRKRYISADPIVAAGRIFTLDSAAKARAFSTSGAAIWSTELTPPHEKPGDASGGGIAFDNGTLIVTTGHGEVISLDPESGAVRWRHKMSGAISAAPVISGNVVVAVARNNTAIGLDISNGRIRWQLASAGSDTGVFGAGSPAATGGLAIIPFASGEVVGVLARNGLRAWSGVISGGHKGIARGFVSDISGDPVIDGSTVYVANQSGRLASLDRRSGERLWTVNEGSYSPVWPAGGAVFMITDTFAVKRLNASDGAEVWSAELPDYKSDRPRRQKDAYAYFGPVLAGGQLWVAGSDGLLRSYNPEDGTLTGTVSIPGGAASQPAIANGTLYIISGNGQLHAFQ